MRIVFGTGNSQKTVNQGTAEFKKVIRDLKRMAAKPPTLTISPKLAPTKPTSTQTTQAIRTVVDKIQQRTLDTLARRAWKWAQETTAEFRNAVPYDTGNLRQSIDVLKFERTKSGISVIVGVDKQKILPPPEYMKSTKTGKMKKMPHRDYSPYVLGNLDGEPSIAKGIAKDTGRGRVGSTKGNRISTTFREIASRNAKKIILKK